MLSLVCNLCLVLWLLWWIRGVWPVLVGHWVSQFGYVASEYFSHRIWGIIFPGGSWRSMGGSLPKIWATFFPFHKHIILVASWGLTLLHGVLVLMGHILFISAQIAIRSCTADFYIVFSCLCEGLMLGLIKTCFTWDSERRVLALGIILQVASILLHLTMCSILILGWTPGSECLSSNIGSATYYLMTVNNLFNISGLQFPIFEMGLIVVPIS